MVARDRAEALAADAQVPAQRPAPIDREEFKLKVMGKTPAEVVEAVGKPDSTKDGRDPTWSYDQRTFDPVTQKVDVQAQVTFSNGEAKRVDFN